MAIIDRQRRLAEVGRIRIGDSEEREKSDGSGTYRAPKKLAHFRFTSPVRMYLEAVAARYGGEVVEWENAPTTKQRQYELHVPASELAVYVPPEQFAFDQYYELWSGKICRRRCDGRTEQISDGDCLCDPEQRDCKTTTRLRVMLAGIPVTGLWRLETHGNYAADELGGAFALFEQVAQATGRTILPGVLRISIREIHRLTIDKRTGTEKPITYHFAVPALDLAADALAVATAMLPPGATQVTLGGVVTPALAAPAAPPAGATPIEGGRGSLVDAVRAVEGAGSEPRKRANSPEPVGATGVVPRGAGDVIDHEDDEGYDETQAGGPSSGPPAAPSAPTGGSEAAGAADGQNGPQDGSDGHTAPPVAKGAPAGAKAPGKASKRQIGLLHLKFAEAGLTERDQYLAYCAQVVGRPLETTNDLSGTEVNRVITALQRDIEQDRGTGGDAE